MANFFMDGTKSQFFKQNLSYPIELGDGTISGFLTKELKSQVYSSRPEMALLS
jgi:hypothetical protein